MQEREQLKPISRVDFYLTVHLIYLKPILHFYTGYESNEQDRPQFQGEEILSPVNGKPVLFFAKADRDYRVRIANVSITPWMIHCHPIVCHAPFTSLHTIFFSVFFFIWYLFVLHRFIRKLPWLRPFLSKHSIYSSFLLCTSRPCFI